MWESFKTKYSITYNKTKTGWHVNVVLGDADKEPGYVNFVDNAIICERYEIMKKKYGWTFTTGLNQFANESNEEFVKARNGFNIELDLEFDKKHGLGKVRPPSKTKRDAVKVPVPKEKDWRRVRGAVTPVKSQGKCGCCYAFAAIGALETNWFLSNASNWVQGNAPSSTKFQLSEQNLVDCSGEFGTKGCIAGTVNQCYRYVRDNEGVNAKDIYPFIEKADTCKYQPKMTKATLESFERIPSGDEERMKEVVGTIGAVAAAMDASLKTFQFYKSGVFNDRNCSSTRLDHGVTVIGYNTTEDGLEYWLVKNSWGPKWGENGFFKLARNKNNMCGIATSASFPIIRV